MMNPLSHPNSLLQKQPKLPQSTPSITDQVDVAVAVIHYNNDYLLGYRNANQDQGNCYEFIGGKIDRRELPISALRREIDEEIGLTLTQDNIVNRLGILHHKYASKTVCLHVYRIGLTPQQFTAFKDIKIGSEAQKLQWVQYNDLIDHQYELPEANATILAWLALPNQITISYDSIDINKHDLSTDASTDALSNWVAETGMPVTKPNAKPISKPELSKKRLMAEWVDFHCQHLARHACVYIRLKSITTARQCQLLSRLCQRRQDIQLIVNIDMVRELLLHPKLISQFGHQLIAQHMTHQQLEEALQVEGVPQLPKDNTQLSRFANLPLTVSCHNSDSVHQANELAQRRLQAGLSPLIGIYLSPVLATTTHPDAKPLQWKGFEQLTQCAHSPIIALGGMSPNDLECVRRFGGDKVAGISQFYQ